MGGAPPGVVPPVFLSCNDDASAGQDEHEGTQKLTGKRRAENAGDHRDGDPKKARIGESIEEDPVRRIVRWEECMKNMAASLDGSIIKVEGDGECQFSAMAHGTDDSGSQFRIKVVNEMSKNAYYRDSYAPEPMSADPASYDDYCAKMSLKKTYGDHRTLVAGSDILQVGIWVYNVVSYFFEYSVRNDIPRNSFLFFTYRPHHYDILNIATKFEERLKELCRTEVHRVSLEDLQSNPQHSPAAPVARV